MPLGLDIGEYHSEAHAFSADETRWEFHRKPRPRFVSWCTMCGSIGYLFRTGPDSILWRHQWRHKPRRTAHRDYRARFADRPA